MGQLHERAGRRVAVVGDLAVEAVDDLGAVAQGSVADAQRFLTAGEEIGDELVDRPDPRRHHLLQATGHLAVHGVEHLALAGVDHRNDDAIRPPVGERQQVERGDADHRQPQRQGQRLGRRQPHAHAGEQAGADVDGHETDLVEADVGLGTDELDRRGERLGVAPATRDLEQGDDALVAGEGHADLFGRRLDAQDQHRRHQLRCGIAQRGPPPRPRRADGADRDPPRVGLAVDHLQTDDDVLAERRLDDVTPFDEHDAVILGELEQGEVSDLGELIEPVQVGVVQRDAGGVVAVHERERRRRDRLVDAEDLAEPLGEGGLPAAHLPRQQDDVAGAAERGEGGGDLVRAGERRGAEVQDRRHDTTMLRRGTDVATTCRGTRGPMPQSTS